MLFRSFCSAATDCGLSVLLALLSGGGDDGGCTPSKAVLVMGLCTLSNLVACDGACVVGGARVHRDRVLAAGLRRRGRGGEDRGARRGMREGTRQPRAASARSGQAWTEGREAVA